jgi:hypothetical protein
MEGPDWARHPLDVVEQVATVSQPRYNSPPMSNKLHQTLKSELDPNDEIYVSCYVRANGSKEVHINANAMYPNELPFVQGRELDDLADMIRRAADLIRSDAQPAPVIAQTDEMFLCHDLAACSLSMWLRVRREEVIPHMPENECALGRVAALALADWLER